MRRRVLENVGQGQECSCETENGSEESSFQIESRQKPEANNSDRIGQSIPLKSERECEAEGK